MDMFLSHGIFSDNSGAMHNMYLLYRIYRQVENNNNFSNRFLFYIYTEFRANTYNEGSSWSFSSIVSRIISISISISKLRA